MRKVFVGLLMSFTMLGVGLSGGEMRVLVLNDTEEHYHWGCYGNAYALKEAIREKGYQVDAVPIRETLRYKKVPRNLDDFTNEKRFTKFVAKNPDLYSALSNHEIIVINGEGSIHGDSPSSRALLYLMYLCKHHLNKRVMVVNHSVFPNDEDAKMYKLAYRDVDFVAVREHISQQRLRNLGIEAVLSYDMLPTYIERHYNKTPEKKNTIVVGGSVVWEKRSMKDVVRVLNEYEAEGYHIQVLVGAKDRPAYDDKLLVKFLKKQLKGNWELVDAESMEKWLDTIASASLLISGRFHYTIAAKCLGTPFIVFNSNTPKIHGILSEEEYGSFCVPYDDEFFREKIREMIPRALNTQVQMIENSKALGEKNLLGLVDNSS